MNDLISIIVPVYNVEQYFDRCIKSILNQTYHNIEVILVNDGSSDCSGNICEKYQKMDYRVKVIHQKNKGPSEARNKALRVAKGDFIAFVDADDYVANDYVMYLYELLIVNEADIACCGTLNIKRGVIKESKKKKHIYIMDSQEALCQMLYEKKFSNSVWGKLYKREMMCEIVFPKGKIFEDMYTTYKIFANSKKVACGNQKKYYYMKHDKSIMNTTKFHDRMQVIEAENELITYLEVYYPRVLKAAYSKLFASSVVCLANFDLDTQCDIYITDINILWKNIVKYRWGILKDKNVQLKYKVYASMSFFGKRMLCAFYKSVVK